MVMNTHTFKELTLFKIVVLMAVLSIASKPLAEPCQITEVESVGYLVSEDEVPCPCDDGFSLAKLRDQAHRAIDSTMISDSDRKSYVKMLSLQQFFENHPREEKFRCDDYSYLWGQYSKLAESEGKRCAAGESSWSDKMCKRAIQIEAHNRLRYIESQWDEKLALKKQVSAWSLMVHQEDNLRKMMSWCKKSEKFFERERSYISGCSAAKDYLASIDLANRPVPPPSHTVKQSEPTIHRSYVSGSEAEEIRGAVVNRDKDRLEKICVKTFGKNPKSFPRGLMDVYVACINYL